MSSVYDIASDKKKVGPGIWVGLNIIAYNATTREEQVDSCKYIRMLIYSFPCQTCRKHAIDYIEGNPPENSISDDSTSLFRWICEFHNYVNEHETHTPKLDWKLVYASYQKNSPKDFGIPKSIATANQKSNESLYKKLVGNGKKI